MRPTRDLCLSGVAWGDVDSVIASRAGATRQLVTTLPDTRVVALSARSDRQGVNEVLRAGAAGFSLKETSVDDRVGAIRAVASGKVYLNPQVVELVCTDDDGMGGPMGR